MSINEYKQLLLAVDFAPETEMVIERARQLVAHCQAQLTLLHVVEHLPVSYGTDLILPDDFDLEKQLFDGATEQMAALGKRLGVPGENQLVEIGPTGRTILRLADRLKPDLIILGSHGRHGLAALLGSTASTVLHGASCDVLAIRIK